MQALLSHYGYIMLFIASFFEGQFSTLFSGFLVWSGHFNLWIAFLVILSADISNDTLYYLIGRGVIRSKKISNFVDQSKFLSRNMTTMKKLWADHPLKTMILGKNAYIISVAIVASAGATKMSYPRFLSYSIPSAFIQPIILLFVGYYLGNGYNLAAQYLSYPGIILAIVLVIIIFTYRSVGKRVAKKFEK
ncbi:MAG: hypothetical protein NT085_00935 [candidate division SR1 bacterium]|nr:hypothetical protein [candidate division SR1 bacterium]